MMDIVEFLTARLDEDEAGALATTPVPVPGRWKVARDKHADDDDPLQLIQGDDPDDPASEDYSSTEIIAYNAYWQAEAEANLRHIARHDPARVLAEVKAKRAIIERHTSGVIRTYQCGNRDHIQDWQCERAAEPNEETRYCEICDSRDGCVELQELAAIHDDHPDYKQGWRVG